MDGEPAERGSALLESLLFQMSAAAAVFILAGVKLFAAAAATANVATCVVYLFLTRPQRRSLTHSLVPERC